MQEKFLKYGRKNFEYRKKLTDQFIDGISLKIIKNK